MVKGRQEERVRLYEKGKILGYKSSKSNQYPNTSLIQIKGVNTKEEVAWYAGKRMAYTYKAKVKEDGSHYRCICGKVTRPHGNSGVVRAKFRSNLPPKSMGNRITDMPKQGSSEASRRGKEGLAVAEEKKLPPAAKKSSDEIDEIFASKKNVKGDKGKSDTCRDALSIQPKKMKKNDKKGRGGKNLNGVDSLLVSRPRKRTGDGLAIYTEDELGIDKAEAGGTPLCPFDCSCCF